MDPGLKPSYECPDVLEPWHNDRTHWLYRWFCCDHRPLPPATGKALRR